MRQRARRTHRCHRPVRHRCVERIAVGDGKGYRRRVHAPLRGGGFRRRAGSPFLALRTAVPPSATPRCATVATIGGRWPTERPGRGLSRRVVGARRGGSYGQTQHPGGRLLQDLFETALNRARSITSIEVPYSRPRRRIGFPNPASRVRPWWASMVADFVFAERYVWVSPARVPALFAHAPSRTC